MNKYIKEIKHTNCEVTDTFERMRGKTIRYSITVTLNRTSEGKCFTLYVDHVRLKNELGHELSHADKLFTGLNHVPALYFSFEVDPDFCELQDNSVFEITLHEARSDKRETFKYVLLNHLWEEITEQQA